MSLLEQIKRDQLEARKAKDVVRASLLTTLFSEASMKGKSDGNRESTDAECIQVVQKFLKGVNETLEALKFSSDGRVKIAIVEKEILGTYLPQMATEAQVRECVAQLKADGAQGCLELIEIAPGIDLERHILSQMDFMPAISDRLKLMDANLFLDKPLGLRERLLETPLISRFDLNRERRLLFINFEGLVVDRPSDIDDIEHTLLTLLEPLGSKVTVIVNYDNFSISPRLFDGYSAMVRRLADRFYQRVTRYGTGGFLKARLESLKTPEN